jgi:acyl-CoA synthetase (AMP-forming)/AMP-acid ligase II
MGPVMGSTQGLGGIRVQPPLPSHYAPRTVPELLRSRARERPDDVAVVAHRNGRDEAMTFAQLDDSSERLAGALMRRWGLPEGSPVAWSLANSHGRAAMVLFHAVLKARWVNVPLNTRLTVDELTGIASHAHCAAAVFSGPSFQQVADRLGLPAERALLVDDDDPAGWEGLLASHAGTHQLPVPRPGDLASILYTSGTTGLPKGVEHTHESSLAAGIGWADAFRLTAADVLQSPFPIFGGAALHFNGLSSLWAGATFVIAPADTAVSLRLVEQWRTTVYVAVPSIYQYWLTFPGIGAADLSSLRILDYGGASMPRRVIEQLSAAFPGVGLMQTYGLTEAGPGGTYLPEEYALERLGSLGSRGAGPFTEFRVIRDDGRDVEADEPGELVLRGPSVMRGYHRDPEATSEVFVDGWLRSGDVVRLDAEGFLYLVDRKKDLILRGGYNISSVEIESALLQHPGIAEAAVFGRPHPTLGETVAAAVVPRPGAALSADDVRAHSAGRLADFKVPQHVLIVAELPRNAAGKVLKRSLGELAGWSDS